MPELPDVQVFKEYLDATSLRQRIEDVDVAGAGRMLQGVTRQALAAALVGRALVSSRRHGKHLFARVRGDGWLWLHFGMTGSLAYGTRGSAPPAHTRLRLDFARGTHLAFVDVRKFGRIGIVEDVDGFLADAGLGPDALGLDLATFRAAVQGGRGAIKPLLMDQTVLAGLGNIYTDEVLFAAGVDPRAHVDRLDEPTVRALHRAIQRVLRAAIAARADVERMPRGFLLPQRHAGGVCPRCGRPLQQLKMGGRTSYLCPHDQPRPGGRSR